MTKIIIANTIALFTSLLIASVAYGDQREGWLPPILELISEPSSQTPPIDNEDEVAAASCSVQDIQNAIALALDGETVRVPAGGCRWSSTLAVNATGKSIRLKGAGVSQTIITVDSTPALDLSGSIPHRWEISDMAFVSNSGGESIANISGSSINWRAHHLKFSQTGAHLFVFSVFGRTYGLLDHLEVSGQNSGIVNLVGGGGEVWTDPMFNQWGDEKAVFLENSVFSFTDHNEGRFTIDCTNGGRYVMRNNVIRNQRTGNHGLDTGGFYSCLSAEIYHNTFHFNGDTSDGAVLWRGGSAQIHSNHFEYDPNTWSNIHVRLPNFRAEQGSNSASWPDCDGTQYKFSNTSWRESLVMSQAGTSKACSENRMQLCSDDNDCAGQGSCSEFVDGTAGVGPYPCFQQVGRGLNNSLEPVYIWNNTFAGAKGEGGFFCAPGQVCDANSVSPGALVDLNRDYYLSQKSVYSAYVYPHPLQGQ